MSFIEQAYLEIKTIDPSITATEFSTKWLNKCHIPITGHIKPEIGIWHFMHWCVFSWTSARRQMHYAWIIITPYFSKKQISIRLWGSWRVNRSHWEFPLSELSLWSTHFGTCIIFYTWSNQHMGCKRNSDENSTMNSGFAKTSKAPVSTGNAARTFWSSILRSK